MNSMAILQKENIVHVSWCIIRIGDVGGAWACDGCPRTHWVLNFKEGPRCFGLHLKEISLGKIILELR